MTYGCYGYTTKTTTTTTKNRFNPMYLMKYEFKRASYICIVLCSFRFVSQARLVLYD